MTNRNLSLSSSVVEKTCRPSTGRSAAHKPLVERTNITLAIFYLTGVFLFLMSSVVETISFINPPVILSVAKNLVCRWSYPVVGRNNEGWRNKKMVIRVDMVC